MPVNYFNNNKNHIIIVHQINNNNVKQFTCQYITNQSFLNKINKDISFLHSEILNFFVNKVK